MNQQQDVISAEREMSALRRKYDERAHALREIPQDPDLLADRRRCLEEFHSAATDYFNAREHLVTIGALSGAEQNGTWFTYQAETAFNLMEIITLHYEALWAKADELDVPRELFKPSPTAFSHLQRLVAQTRPGTVPKWRAAFEELCLPTVGFDSDEAAKAPRSLADVLVVTVNQNETRAVLAAIERATGVKAAATPIGDRVYRDLGAINDTRIFHALSQMGSGGLGAAQQTVEKAIIAIRPKAVIAVGIAFGVNDKKQSIGDVLVSKQLWLYDLQRVGEEIKPRGDKPAASPRLVNFFEGVAQTSWDEDTSVKFGLLLTGEKLIDHVDYRNQLLKFESEAVGGEMEGAGVYVASHDHKAEWIVIKAICDWADGNKKKNKQARQQNAAANASSFLVHALQQASLKALL